jgi:hypothetical protein
MYGMACSTNAIDRRTCYVSSTAACQSLRLAVARFALKCSILHDERRGQTRFGLYCAKAW